MRKKNEVYNMAKTFARRHPGTIAWRLRAHCKVAQDHINDDEEILYVFAAQKGTSILDIISTHVIVVTDKRLVLAQDRLIYGYFFYSITPDMFNDLTIKMGLIWGKVIVDTIKETVVLSNLSKNSLQELETVLSKYMMQKKRELEAGASPEETATLEAELLKIAQNGE